MPLSACLFPAGLDGEQVGLRPNSIERPVHHLQARLFTESLSRLMHLSGGDSSSRHYLVKVLRTRFEFLKYEIQIVVVINVRTKSPPAVCTDTYSPM